MRYTVSAKMISDLEPTRIRFQQHWTLRLVWRVIAPALFALCYLGLFFATIFVECLVPGNVLSWPRGTVSEGVCWSIVAISLAGIVGASILSAVVFRRFLRVRSIDIDMITFLLGSVVSICLLSFVIWHRVENTKTWVDYQSWHYESP